MVCQKKLEITKWVNHREQICSDVLFTDIYKNIYQILKLYLCQKSLHSLLRFSDNWVWIVRQIYGELEKTVGS